MKFQNNMDLSVIIPAHLFNENFKQCLKALEDAVLLEVFELIVVLDGFDNDLAFWHQFNIPSLKVIELKENNGPAFARNIGSEKAKGDILFFIDSDVMIKPDTLKKVKQYFVNPNAKSALIGSYDNDPGQTSLVSNYRNLLHHYTHQQASERATTFWGACGAIKKEAFLSVGGFDTSFTKSSVEDIELGYRLIQNGHEIRLDKKLQIKHLKKWSLVNTLETDIFQRAIPWTKLIHQYRKLGVSDLNISNEERLAVVLLSCALLTLIAASVFIELLAFSVVCFMGLILVKRKTYLFFLKSFALYEMPLVVLLHWCYLLSAVIGFILGTGQYLILSKNTNHISQQNDVLLSKYRKENTKI